MKIHLVRHGKPDFWRDYSAWTFLSGAQIQAFSERYDAAGILPDPAPAPDVMQAAQSAAMILSSDLRRAVESARRLAPAQPIHTDAIFREAGFSLDFGKAVILPLFGWMFLTRLLWEIGYEQGGESLAMSRRRAAQAAAILTTRARQHGDVMLVGHGWLNYLICSHLKREGWQANSGFKRHYWDCNTLAAPPC